MKYKALCASCGKQFMVDESQERKDNKWTRCPHCQSRICISFLGWCPTCHDYMAFKQRFAKDLGKGVIDFISSIPSIASSSKRLRRCNTATQALIAWLLRTIIHEHLCLFMDIHVKAITSSNGKRKRHSRKVWKRKL